MFSSEIFDNIRDTPHKKVKLNENSTYASQRPTSNKLSFLDRMQPRNRTPKRQISEFEIPFQYKSSNSAIQQEMEQQPDKNVAGKLMLNRKFTLQLREEEQQPSLNTLHLYRSNSTCEQIRKTQEINLGDNIYLKRLGSKTENLGRRTQYNYSQRRLRIEQDYEIEKNLKFSNRQHESYICLNRLERIFYYVRKIVMNWYSHQNYQFLQSLIAQQIKVYHTDPQDHFLRFYQEWFEENALYLTFQVGIQSLADANLARNKLRELQVWDLLRDATSALKWLNQYHQLPHLNVKPGNIIKCQKKFKLVDPYCTPSVLKNYLQKQRQNASSWHYLAPQIKNFSFLLEGLNFNQADIYALGICIIQNLLGEKYVPMEGKALRNYIQKHIHGYSPSLMRVLMRMVSSDPEKRPRAAELCEINKRETCEEAKPRRRFSM